MVARYSSDHLSGPPSSANFRIVYIFPKIWALCLLAVFDDGSDQGDVYVVDIFHAFVCVGPTNSP